MSCGQGEGRNSDCSFLCLSNLALGEGSIADLRRQAPGRESWASELWNTSSSDLASHPLTFPGVWDSIIADLFFRVHVAFFLQAYI